MIGRRYCTGPVGASGFDCSPPGVNGGVIRRAPRRLSRLVGPEVVLVCGAE